MIAHKYFTESATSWLHEAFVYLCLFRRILSEYRYRQSHEYGKFSSHNNNNSTYRKTVVNWRVFFFPPPCILLLFANLLHLYGWMRMCRRRRSDVQWLGFFLLPSAFLFLSTSIHRRLLKWLIHTYPFEAFGRRWVEWCLRVHCTNDLYKHCEWHNGSIDDCWRNG